MEKFRKKILKRIMLISLLSLLSAVLGAYGLLEFNSSEKVGMMDENIIGFQIGIIFGIVFIGLFQIIRLRMMVKNDKKLKMLYNQEHDERLKTIRSKAGMPMLMITSVMMLIAANIAGYYNVTVFYTLVIAAAMQLSIGAIVKLYYMKTI